MERILDTDAYDASTQPKIVPIEEGGTGQVTAIDAINALGGISKTTLGVPGGTCPLGADRIIPAEFIRPVSQEVLPAIIPPAMILPLVANKFTITNIDSLTEYVITALHGAIDTALLKPSPFVEFSSGTFEYTSQESVAFDTITINGRPINIAIQYPKPLKPTIYNLSSQTRQVADSYVVSVSPFQVVGGQDTQLQLEYQLATDIDFTTIVGGGTLVTATGTTFILAGLELGTQYYVRVRYWGNAYGAGEWSDPGLCTLNPLAIPTNELAIILPDQPSTWSAFGTSIAHSGDGNIIAIGAPDFYDATANGNVGAVYVFVNTAAVGMPPTYVQRDVLYGSVASGNNPKFGHRLAVSLDGNTLIITSPGADAGPNTGWLGAYVYENSQWVKKSELYGLGENPVNDLGYLMVASDTCSTIVVADMSAHYIVVRAFDGLTLSDREILAIPPSAGATVAMALSPSGNHLVLGFAEVAVDGQAYLYENVAGVFTLQHTFSSDPAIHGINNLGEWFGNIVAVNADGTEVLISDDQEDPDTHVYSYHLVNGVWSDPQIYISGDAATTGGAINTIQLPPSAPTLSFLGSQWSSGSSYPTNGPWSGAGEVFIYAYGNSAWVKVAALEASDIAASTNFGYAVSATVDATRLFVGAPHRQNDTGGVYLFV